MKPITNIPTINALLEMYKKRKANVKAQVLLACVIYFFPHVIHVYFGLGWLILYWLFFGVQTTISLIVILLIVVDSLND